MSDNNGNGKSTVPLEVILGGAEAGRPGRASPGPRQGLSMGAVADALGFARELPRSRVAITAVMDSGEKLPLKAYQMPREEAGVVPILAFAPPGQVVGLVKEMHIHIPGSGQVERVECNAHVGANQCVQLKLEFNEGVL